MESNDSLIKTGIPGAVLTISGILLLLLEASSTLVVYGGAVLVILGVLSLTASILGRESSGRIRSPAEASAARQGPGGSERVSSSAPTEPARLPQDADSFAPALGELTIQFNDWLDQFEDVQDIWPAFDRWLRDVLNHFSEARRVRCFRIVENRKEPVPLTDGAENALWFGTAPHELLDHVIRSGHRYLRGAERHDVQVGELISEWRASMEDGDAAQLPRLPDAILPMQRKGRAIGLVVIGDLSDRTLHDLVLLRAVEQLINQFWRHVDQHDSLSTAHRIDRASGVLNRLDLTQIADDVLLESSLDHEPVVVLAIVVEGVRWLDDHGQWTLRDWLMKQIGLTMREKLRSDDLVGRFSDDRFVALLRRLDLDLGRIIAQNLMKLLNERITTNSESCPAIRLRCGLSQSEGSDFALSLARCFEAVNEARQADEEIRVMEPGSRAAQEAKHEV